MLTRRHALAGLDWNHGRIVPDRLTRQSHARYARHAERMLRVYQLGQGRARGELHGQVRAALAGEADCPPRRADAFCKLLDDASEFDRDRRGAAAALRREVFRLAAAHHPLSDGGKEAKAEIARRLRRPWEEIERDLFADVIDHQRLMRFDGFADGRELLSRYNVAQTQAALYRATRMTIWATADFKTILRYAKLARLMHSIVRRGREDYEITLDGPASVLRQSRRYGAAMAKFLPALIACRGWRMESETPTRGRRLRLELSANDGLRSHLPPPEQFDSRLEQSFADEWGQEPRDGWRMVREGEILHRGQKVFLPDFVFRHRHGKSVLMEIVGFWTPEYVREKALSLTAFHDHNILLALGHSARRQMESTPPNAVIFRSAIPVAEVLARLNEYLRR